MSKRLIDVDRLIAFIKLNTETIKMIRHDGQCFYTEENILKIIEEQKVYEEEDE